MINIKLNKTINKKLSELYIENTLEFLSVYKESFNDTQPPSRINEFGIINVEKYNSDNGILVIGKETNGWDIGDFEKGLLFRNWLNDVSINGITDKGHISKHPNMWYNIGRWLLAVNEQNRNIEEIAELKREVLPQLGTMAYTNLNKVRGKGNSKKEYESIAYSNIAGRVLRSEIDIIRPKIIICCGTWRPVKYHLNGNVSKLNDCKIICMPHPTCRKKKIDLLKDLMTQIEAKQ